MLEGDLTEAKDSQRSNSERFSALNRKYEALFHRSNSLQDEYNDYKVQLQEKMVSGSGMVLVV